MAISRSFAKPYAKALFELSADNVQRGLWLHRLQVLDMVFQDPQIRRTVSRMSGQKGLEWLQSILKDGIDGGAYSLLALLLQYKRLALINEIRLHFADLMVEYHGFGILYLTSAVELQDDERASVLAMFEKQFGEKLIPHYRTDPAIRGGVIGRVKDLVYDGSLRGSLDKLRENLIQ